MSLKRTVKPGDVFDDLTIIGLPFASGKNRRVPYRCVCGKEGDREIHSLFDKLGFVKNCGCNRRKARNRQRTFDPKIFNQLAQDFYLGITMKSV